MSSRSRFSSWMALCALGLASGFAVAHPSPTAVSVEVVDEDGRRFEEFPLTGRDAATYRAYLKARRGASYRIRIVNRSSERVGVVVAVDGRNIISGDRSELRPHESMYVLDPWETGDYRGWRTSLDTVHEFYFTEWPDSYAERTFKDSSAQGVIAMAVYRDREWQARREQQVTEKPAGRADRAQDQRGASAAAPPGTGFGEQRHDPARRVEFHAEHRPMSRSFIKYEWPETLCRKRIGCGLRNRFWPDEHTGFAPPPPRALSGEEQ